MQLAANILSGEPVPANQEVPSEYVAPRTSAPGWSPSAPTTGGPATCPRSGSRILEQEHSPVLATRSVNKRFGATRALTDVSFACFAGEVHAVVGQNGAGKSTLMNLFAGVFSPSSGEILLDGAQARFGHPAEARRAGIRTVYQVPDLIPHLDVAQNLFLGEEPGPAPGLLSPSRLYQQAQELLARLRLDLPLRQPVSQLSLSQQQLLTVARALAAPLRVLILDEPTAPLGPRETEYLYELIGRCRQEGAAILYISHRLEEVLQLADRITVLRDGKLVATGPASETSRRQVVAQMTGGSAVGAAERVARRAPRGPVVLEVKGLQGPGLGPFHFRVRAGEIVGVGGLVGAGRSELLRLIFGADRPTAGEVDVAGAGPGAGEVEAAGARAPLGAGARLPPGNPKAAVDAGVGFLTEERLLDGLAAGLPVQANVSMTRLSEVRGERKLAQRVIDRLQIRARPEQPVSELSGGNQQKVALGKWLKDDIRVLLVDEPTQGVDVGAKEEIHRQLCDLADSGVGVLLVSSEFAELIALSDRILVMREGRLVEELVGGGLAEVDVVAAAVG